MIQGVIFDADGTILDSTAMWMEAGARYLASIGIKADPTVGEKMFSMTLTDSADYLRTLYQLTLTSEEIIAGINQSIERYYQSEVTLKPGARELIERLFHAGIPMTLATATDTHLIKTGLLHTGILPYFKGIFTCGEIGKGKDQPDIYLAARDAMGTETSATWVFEDALHGAQTAKDAGFLVAGIYDTMSHSHKRALKAICDLYLDDLCHMEAFYSRYHKTI